MTSSKNAWQQRKRQWEIYQRWAERQRFEELDLATAMRWYNDAWRLAAQFGWGDLPEVDPSKYKGLRRWRQAVMRREP